MLAMWAFSISSLAVNVLII